MLSPVNCTDQHSIVILSEAKDLHSAKETLRFAQGDRELPILIGNVHKGALIFLRGSVPALGNALDNSLAYEVYSFVVQIIVTNNHCYPQWIVGNQRKA